jgi:hypothetical protein
VTARRSVGLVLVLGTLVSARLHAQEIEGRVQLGGASRAGVPVTLHRVTTDSSGAIAAAVSDAAGRFRLALPSSAPDAFTVFFATAEFHGVRYFGPPVHPGDTLSAYVVEVHDTTSVPAPAEAVQLARRDVVLISEAQGGWEVNEILRLRNPGSRTLLPRDGVSVWEMTLPPEVVAFEVAEGELGPSAVSRFGSRVLLTSPLVPGTQELLLRYRVPFARGGLHLAVEQPTEEMNVLIREPAPRLAVAGLREASALEAEGERFLRFTGQKLRAGEGATVRAAGGSAPLDPRLAAGVAAGSVLACGAWLALRRSSTPAAEPLRADR